MGKLDALRKLLRRLRPRIFGGRAARVGVGAEGVRRDATSEPADDFVGGLPEDGREEIRGETEMTRKQKPNSEQAPDRQPEYAERQAVNKAFEWVKEQLIRMEEQSRKLFQHSQNLNDRVISNTREINFLRSENSNLTYNQQQVVNGLRDVQAQIRGIGQQVAELFDRHATLRSAAGDITQRLAAVEQSVKDLRDMHVAEKLNASGSLSVAGSDGQPRLIANKLMELRAQNTRRVVNSILGHMHIDGDRRANSARVGNILSDEIYIRSQEMLRGESDGQELPVQAVNIIRREILNRLGFRSGDGLPTEFLQELEQLIAEGAGLTFKALRAKPAGVLWLEPEGTPLDSNKHEVIAGCPDAVAVSQVQFTSHPGYKVNDVVYVKALVYTKESPPQSTSGERGREGLQEFNGF